LAHPADTLLPDEAQARSEPFMSKRRKTVPEFQSEAKERAFRESHDSSDYVYWSKAQRVSLPNLKPSTKTISLRLPVALLERIRIEADRRIA
jgi:hypothetical protein